MEVRGKLSTLSSPVETSFVRSSMFARFGVIQTGNSDWTRVSPKNLNC
jgi:hypothetical protein